MFVLFGIIIHLLMLFILAGIIAVFFALAVYCFSKKKRGRKTVCALLVPFVCVYSFYFCCLIGAFVCSSVFNTGCGMDGYWRVNLPNGYEMYSLTDDFDNEPWGKIMKNGDLIIDEVIKIKVEKDTLFLAAYVVDETRERYFALDTRTGDLLSYGYYTQAKIFDENIVSGLYDTENFYYSNWGWVIPLSIFALFVSVGAVWVILRMIIRRE